MGRARLEEDRDLRFKLAKNLGVNNFDYLFPTIRSGGFGKNLQQAIRIQVDEGC